MENNSGFWKWIGAAALVIVLGVGLGYFVSAPQKPATEIATAPVADSSQPPLTTALPSAHPPPPIGQYTAKGAPEIQIQETAPDASKAKPPTTAPVTPPPTKPVTPPPTAPDQTTLPTEAPTPLATTPTADPNAPAPPAPVAPTVPDPTPAPPPAPSAQTPPPVDNSPVYHVLVGTTFSSEKNARIFAADLRHRGFMAMTASVSSDSGIVYKVQVGAYHNRLSAEEAASQLQQSGYPAYIATDR